jgi:ribosomal-protein-alanine N-acetyltransferase
MPEIVLATRFDAPAIAMMSRRLVEGGLPWAWTARRVARHIQSRESLVVLGRKGSRLLGFGIMFCGEHRSHLNLLAVEPTARRAGVGTALVSWLETAASTAGTFFIDLEVRAANLSAQRFYRRLGYEERGRVPGYYYGRETAVRMTHDMRVPSASPS